MSIPGQPGSNTVRVRFAPSPTGYLHVGGARTALFNWLFARAGGGTFVLRIEDTDASRNTAEAIDTIYNCLRWLGIDWDEGPDREGECGPYLQSLRTDIYDRRFQELVDGGHTYTEENGAVRFRTTQPVHVLDDQICGPVRIDRSQEPDMTIRRPDGSYIFHFVNVVDDIEMGITHVIRGEDHIYNTGKHLELFEAFGAKPPVYAHIPLILNPDGSKMSKRDQGASVEYYIQEGFLPEAVRNYLCLLGWSPKDDREILSVDEILPLFRWENMGRHNAKFDLNKCRWMNAQYVARMEPDSFVDACRSWMYGKDLPGGADPAAVDAALKLMQPKVRTFPDIVEHLRMLFDPEAPADPEVLAKLAAKPDTRGKLQRSAAHLEALVHWEAGHIRGAIDLAASELNQKPGALMFPLRAAVTGQGHGVDLIPALELLGKEETVRRIRRRLEELPA